MKDEPISPFPFKPQKSSPKAFSQEKKTTLKKVVKTPEKIIIKNTPASPQPPKQTQKPKKKKGFLAQQIEKAKSQPKKHPAKKETEKIITTLSKLLQPLYPKTVSPEPPKEKKVEEENILQQHLQRITSQQKAARVEVPSPILPQALSQDQAQEPTKEPAPLFPQSSEPPELPETPEKKPGRYRCSLCLLGEVDANTLLHNPHHPCPQCGAQGKFRSIRQGSQTQYARYSKSKTRPDWEQTEVQNQDPVTYSRGSGKLIFTLLGILGMLLFGFLIWSFLNTSYKNQTHKKSLLPSTEEKIIIKPKLEKETHKDQATKPDSQKEKKWRALPQKEYRKLLPILEHFLSATSTREKLPYILRGNILRDSLTKYYKNPKRFEEEQSFDSSQFLPLLHEKKDIERGIFVLKYERLIGVGGSTLRASQDMTLTSVPQNIMIIFRKTAQGPKLDWEIFQQTKDRSFEKFLESPDQSPQTFRLIALPMGSKKQPDGEFSAPKAILLASPAYPDVKIQLPYNEKHPEMRRFWQTLLQDYLDTQADIEKFYPRSVTLRLGWQNQSSSYPKLIINRFVCLEFLGIGNRF